MVKEKIKIGFLTKRHPNNRRTWSGTIYYIYQSISTISNVEVVWIPAENSAFRKLVLLPFTLTAKLLGKNHSTYFTLVSRFYGKNIDKQKLSEIDVLFVPSQSIYFAYLDTNKPIIYLTDATFKQIHNYYEAFSNLWNPNIRQCNIIHQAAYYKAWRIIATSDWTKNSLIDDYNISSDKIRLIEFGANVNDSFKYVAINKTADYLQCLNILFFGVDWVRKGGDVAVETVKTLNEMGFNTCLYVVGLEPPIKYQGLDYIKTIGFLDKSKEDDYATLIALIEKSHLLLLPSKAECAGIVFCEASACGIPSFAYNTGGVSNYVIDGENGYLLQNGATGRDFAEKIKSVVFYKRELDDLQQKCIKTYQEKLNWDVWQEKFIDLLKEYKLEENNREKDSLKKLIL